MKGLKIFLYVVISLLLIAGLYSKIQGTEFGYFSTSGDKNGVNHSFSIILTGNRILAFTLILAIPLIIILSNKKGRR
jgi:hypothetical protein